MRVITLYGTYTRCRCSKGHPRDFICSICCFRTVAAVFLDHFRKHAFSFANGRQWVLTNAEAHEMDKLYDRLSGFAQLSPPAPSTPRAVCAENAKVRHFWTTLFWLEIMEKIPDTIQFCWLWIKKGQIWRCTRVIFPCRVAPVGGTAPSARHQSKEDSLAVP